MATNTPTTSKTAVHPPNNKNNKPFNASTDIPPLTGKTILITGANSGLGRQASLELARFGRPAKLWMACRDPVKGREAVEFVKNQLGDSGSSNTVVTFLELDLASFDSIKAAARKVIDSSDRLDILMLNAGLMAPPPSLTPQNYEIQMGTNHLGHALLLKLLTPLLLASASPARVVSLSSSAWKYLDPLHKIQFSTLKGVENLSAVPPVNRYIQSKTANMLYAKGYAKYSPHREMIKIVAVDPGEVDTLLFKREAGDDQMRYLQTEVAPLRVRPVEDGVKNQIWAAAVAGDEEVVNGGLYEPVGRLVEASATEGSTGNGKRSVGVLEDEELVDELWRWTEAELQGHEI